MIEKDYDFTSLVSLLERKYVYPSDAIEMLDRIESALTNLEQVIVLKPEIVSAINFFEELKLVLDAAIPNEKRRF